MSSSPSKKRRSRQKNETNELPFLASRSTGTRSPHGVFASFISNLQDDHHVAAKETEASKPEFSRIPHSSSHSTSNNVNREESKDGETLNSNKTVPLLERRGSTYSTLELEESSELASILKELGAWPPTKEGNHLDSYLPLQAYYDRSKDPVTIEQVEFPVQNATALILGEWRDCVVSGARQLDGGVWVFLVEPLSQQVKAKVGGKAVELGRVEVLFPWESRVAFAKRYARAVRLRHSASTLLRYNLYIDCMPKESAQEGGSEARQSEEQLERIIRAAMGGSGNALRDAKARIDVSALLQDVENSYVRTLNKIDFDIKLGSSSIEALRRDGLEELPAVLDKAYPSKETPYKGCLTIPAYDVEHVFNSIQSKCFLAESASLAALDKVHVLCQNLFLEPFALFCTTTNGESLRFSEFDEIQRLQIDHVTNRIRDDWTHTIKNSIKKCLAEDTADRWHLDEKNRANYEASDLKRLFVNVNLRMEDSLRDFIVKNVEKYSAFVLATTNCKVTVKSISVVDVQHLAKGPLTMEQKLPLFRIEVVEELRLPKARTPRQHEGDEHAGEEEEEEEEEHAEVDEDMATEKLFFGYSEDLEKFAQLPQTMLSHALHCIQEIPQVQRLAMDRIYWTQIPYVSVVSPEEEWVQETQEKLHKSVSTAFRPLHQYLAKFDEFLEFLRLDVDAFMHTLEEPFIIAEEKRKRRIEKEERRAQKLKEKLEREERRLREQEEAQGSDGITSSSGDTAQAGEGGKEAVSEEKQNTQDERGDAGPGEEANEEEEEEEEEDDDDDDDNADTPVLNTDLIANYISTHLNKRDELEKRVPSEISLGAFMVDCEKLKKKLIAKHEEIVQKLLDFVNRCTVSQCSTLLLKYADMNKELSKYPHNIEELVAMKDYINTIPNKLSEIHEEIAKLWRGYDLLDQYNYRLPTKVFSQKWKLFGGTKMVLDKVDVTTAMLEKEKINYAKIQEEKQEEFWVDLDKLSREVASFSQYSDLRRVNSIAQNAADIAEKIREAQAKADLFNSRETLFEKELTDYEQVVEIGRAFQPYEIMWATVKSWVDSEEKWMKGKFNDLVPEEMEKQVTESYKLMNRSIKFFQKAELPLIKDSAEVIKDKIEKFRPYMPMITALRNQGMRDRHYEKISEDLGFTIDPSADDFSLVEAIRLKLHEHSEVIAKVSGVAAKEFQIEQSLQKMRSEWEHVVLDCRAYKDTGTYVLGGIDEIIALLDEHLTLTQAMQFSSFKGPFVEQIDEFDSKLSTTSEVIEEWIAVQRNWLYLQPIFESPDIAKQLPAEAKRFQSVDKNWRTTLLQASKGAKALEFCSNPKLLEMFSESNKLLDMVSKGLSDYLETKRGGFSRFYFLSNDELLEILSETKDPTMVQPHLKKCFEGIRSVFFNENMHITDMKSSEGEVVPLNTIVNPEGKNVEVWMTELEERMMDSVKKVMWESMLSYVEMARTDWLQVVPGQCALNASQFHWTREIEESLDAEGNSGVGKCFDQQVRQINDMVALVRDPELKSNARMTISALTVIDVHARDVTEKLFKEGVQTRHDFLWISQMRYYWQEGEALEGDMKVMMVSSLRPYGYEYLGNSFRLVITPLTDKCYLTLMGALQMNLGGAPAGPAGTGKTETTKDLAKALAKQCVVFNCSDGLDYLAMGKFFKGLASCGAWACFDEFNRIDVEVLSVVAQQIMTLQAGVSAGLTRIVFEGVEIRLSDQFAVYITMNPGYAGRTELPDNLKALFRPVAMMVPDYALIGEIMLYSFGYEKARICAKKMVATFQLCSEQLSSQPHYDYGMRAVKTVIVAAGNLRRDYPNEDEEILLLRALQDVNLPKFLSFDLPLFKGIISDLFPGKSRPDIDYGALLECLRIVNESTGLQNTPWFLQKQIQLYETIVVRHGLMLVGPTGGGKSRNVENLDAALTMLKKRGVKGFAYEKVHRHTVNPKSITMGQLYGEFDPNTHEWQDGILANIVRICAKSTTPDRKWVMFDGPVDAIWIENMNTVLDDNKKLCLNSGEIMALSAEMTMMFEVEDLAVASPATVSRVGVIYMEPATLGSDPVIQSWIEYRLPAVCTLEHKTRLQILFDTYLQSAITVLRRRLFEPVPTVTNNVVQSLMRVMDSLFHYHLVLNAATGSDANNDDDDGPAKGKSSGRLELDTDLEPLFFFSLVWSVCCTTDTAGRRTFDGWLRNKMDQNCSSFSFPREGMIYDYVWDIKTHSWVGWMDTIEPYKYDRDLPFAETIIPTSDSVCYTYLLDILLRNNQHVLMCGDTGTGKSININRHLSSGMPSEYIPINMAFSAQTSANQTQDLLDSKMEKRRKGVFGPPAGKQFLIFVDDLNMPKRETYFAQPPIELLRQWFTYGGWYDRKTLQFRKIIDVSMVAAMGPPGGGRNPVTPRLLRHYNIITYTPLEQASMMTIFGTILSNFLKDGFDSSVLPLAEPIVDATIHIYNTIREELLPTPSKSHYTFNMRDLSKVFQGMLMVSSKVTDGVAPVVRLWVHEASRVFRDRLVNDEDRQWFDRLVVKCVDQFLNLDWETKIKPTDSEYLIFGDLLEPDSKVYQHVEDVNSLLPAVEQYLNEYNAESKSPMNLKLFMDAIQHISRIARVIRQPMGNALLLGVGGSGRKSLSRLAAYIGDFQLFQVEISKGYGLAEWREDIKSCLLKAGVEDIQVVFLFDDTQIVFSQMLEDINGILNQGDVPNLYPPEDMEKIMTACRGDCAKRKVAPTKINIFASFINRVKRNVHVVMCMSPGTPIFRDRLRMFPSLVNCCTIDWFSEWPDEALQSVGMGIMQEVDLQLGDKLSDVVELFRVFHQSVAVKSKEFFDELRRYNYVTPTSYLELLNTFKALLQQKRDEVLQKKHRLQVGLDKLTTTAAQVAELQIQLTEMQPVLAKTQVEVDEMIVQLKKDKAAADETMQIVSVEEKAAQEKAMATQAIADDAQRDLDEALPALDEAVKCLSKLKKADIVEVASLKTPPSGVKLTMEAACIMFQVKPKMVADPNNMGKKLKDYWEPAQKNLLSDANKLLSQLFNFDKDNIPEKVIREIEPYIESSEFQPKEIEKASKACTAICMWVRAMHMYHYVAKAVEPKREKLREAQAELDVTMAKLQKSRDELKKVMDRIQELEDGYQQTLAKKEQLAQDVEQCSARLDRAHKLIGGLGGEKDRWTASVQQFDIDYVNLLGDVLIASGCIAYLGPFTSTYRASLVKKWTSILSELDIPHSPETNMIRTLGNAVEIRSWQVSGLPADNHSTENAIVIKKARRWPLLIDPQTQANRFIKNLGKESANGIEVTKASNRNFLRQLENGVRFGKWVLLESVGEKLDAALEPILLQQVFKQDGQMMIKLGDNTVPYHEDFRFFMTTKLPNPHYPPEVSVKVSLLNFSITPLGLEEQLLGLVMVNELPELEAKKNEIVVQNAAMGKQLQEIEDKILYMLSNSQGNILDDAELISTLADSKVTSQEINEKVAEAKETEVEIDNTRELYRSFATRGSILYFSIADLFVIDPMYQYSLQWFSGLFSQSILNSERKNDVDERLEILKEHFTYSLYENICRSLFESHKLLFAFNLCIRIMQAENLIDPSEWRFLLTGQAGKVDETDGVKKPSGQGGDWVTDKSWSEIRNLSTLPALHGFDKDFANHLSEWKHLFDSERCQEEPLPGDWETRLNDIQHMIVLRALRPDKLTESIQNFIIKYFGQQYIEPPPFDMKKCFDVSMVTTPLIFVLTSGSDPTKDFFQFAEQMGMADRTKSISLGQGQGPIAERMIEEGINKGSWVLLQNCHLCSSWMDTLEMIVEELNPDACHAEFRLWLTSMPTKTFPVSVLQIGIKMTKEPPKGMRANLKSIYYKFDDDILRATTKPGVYMRLLFGLCFFHALVQERRKFGPLGWNRQYEFNNTDLDISQKQLELYIDAYEEIPYDVLHFLTSYINYGGRITDAIDSRTADVILKDFFTPDILKDGYQFSPSGVYHMPALNEDAPHHSFTQYISSLPVNADPEVFGMHQNANISCALTDVFSLLDTLVLLQPRTSGGKGESREDVVLQDVRELLSKLPPSFDLEGIRMEYPTKYEDSMNTILNQEATRYEKLLSVIRSTLKQCEKALQGFVVMSAELEAMSDSMYNQKVPEMWEAASYPSMKPLKAWFAEFLDRVKFFSSWVENGAPSAFWISGFFFPQAFFTGQLQNYARARQIPINTTSFSQEYPDIELEDITRPPESGAYIYGLFVEGARWDKITRQLEQPLPKKLYDSMPVIHFKPEQNRQELTRGVYRMPLYKVLSRAGTLSTTGHSTNFITFFTVPASGTEFQNVRGQSDIKEWVKAGVACFCSLKF